ncbi:MAG TPA: hypothetical protein VFO54_05255 [Chryseosolibacter sp.]|nr:hypothetical protein [Chryseosolibacter sp.]
MQITIDVINTREEVYRALVESEENQSIIGIASEELGPGMFLTSVKEVLDDAGEVVVVLNNYDTTGYFLEKNRVSLTSIKGVIPFKAVFRNPFLKELQKTENPVTPASERKPDYIF